MVHPSVRCGRFKRCLAFYRATDKTKDLLTRVLRSCAGNDRQFMLRCDDQTVINHMYAQDLQMQSKWNIFDVTPEGELKVTATSAATAKIAARSSSKTKVLYFPNRVAVSPVTGVKVVIWNTTLTPRGTSAWNCTAVDRHQIWVAMPLAPKVIDAKIRVVRSYGRFLDRCSRYKDVHVSREEYLKNEGHQLQKEGDQQHWCAICRCCNK